MNIDISVLRSRFLFVSGINFYNEVGFLALGSKGGEYTTQVKATAKELNQPVDVLPFSQLRLMWPDLAIDETWEGVYTNHKSGHISPRNLVAAQKEAARLAGCDIIDDIVKRLTPIGSAHYQIEVERSGRLYRSQKVLLATGAFTEFRSLLPQGLKPDLTKMGVMVLLVRPSTNLP